MSTATIQSLGELIQSHREELLERWRGHVGELPSAKNLDTPALNDHIPSLIDELACTLRSRSEEAAEEILIDGSPPVHGRQRLQIGFDIEEVVAEYNLLRRSIHELAEARGLTIRGNSLHIVNRVLDEAIGLAVQTYATERALEVKKQREEYLAFVVHDLKTPLNAISMAADVMKLQLANQPENECALQMLGMLQRNARQLGELLNNVLMEYNDLAGESRLAVQRRSIEVWPLVESVIKDLKPVAVTAGVELTNNVPAGLQISADAELLFRVFQNLLTNAIRYTPRGTVRVESHENPAEDAVEFRIVDNGSGISPELLPQVFDKFATDGEQDGSRGLGLSIVKRFVEAHGGSITVESHEGIGSTFTFRLPALR